MKPRRPPKHKEFSKYLDSIIRYRIKFIKITHNHVFNPGKLKKLNNAFSDILNRFNKDKVIIPGTNLLPSLVKEYYNDSTIKPFWTTKIQTLSDKLFLPTENHYNVIEPCSNTAHRHRTRRSCRKWQTESLL